jgi:hypothetical protein
MPVRLHSLAVQVDDSDPNDEEEAEYEILSKTWPKKPLTVVPAVAVAAAAAADKP